MQIYTAKYFANILLSFVLCGTPNSDGGLCVSLPSFRGDVKGREKKGRRMIPLVRSQESMARRDG